ncbi:gene transfer agent family protein [Thioclava sp. BHET1]|nr:gene transfer agent family protein [Thioclava sp. BHET1]
MVNPWAGEVEIMLDGEPYRAKLTLGALAELEAAINESGGMIALVERFDQNRFSSGDVLALIVAGLRGGGWEGDAARLRCVEIGSGPLAAAAKAAELLARAFSVPGEDGA